MLLDKSRNIFKPVNAIVFFAVLYYLASSIIVYLGDYPSHQFEFIWYLSNSILIAWWVVEDKKDYNFHAPFEFGAFVFFAWVVVVPYYLWKTRGRKSIGWSILVVGYFFIPSMYWFLVENYWWVD